jgi:hypothetical protein
MKRFTSLLVAAVSMLVLWAGPALAKTSARHKEVRQLLTLTGAAKMGDQMMQQMIASFKQSFPNVPKSYWKKLSKSLDANEMVELVIPVYERHLGQKDIKELIAFFKTRVGRKFIRVQPEILRESMAIGQAWGQKVGQRVMKDLQAMQKKGKKK